MVKCFAQVILVPIFTLTVYLNVAFAKPVPVSGFAGMKFGNTIKEIKAKTPFGVKPDQWTVEKVTFDEFGDYKDNWLWSFDVVTKFAPFKEKHSINVVCRINSEGKLCQINVTVFDATTTENLDMLNFLGKYGEPKGIEETGWDGFLSGDNPWVLCEYSEGNMYLMYEDTDLYEYHGCRH